MKSTARCDNWSGCGVVRAAILSQPLKPSAYRYQSLSMSHLYLPISTFLSIPPSFSLSALLPVSGFSLFSTFPPSLSHTLFLLHTDLQAADRQSQQSLSRAWLDPHGAVLWHISAIRCLSSCVCLPLRYASPTLGQNLTPSSCLSICLPCCLCLSVFVCPCCVCLYQHGCVCSVRLCLSRCLSSPCHSRFPATHSLFHLHLCIEILRNFLINGPPGYRDFVVARLDRCIANGTRSRPPTSLEIQVRLQATLKEEKKKTGSDRAMQRDAERWEKEAKKVCGGEET